MSPARLQFYLYVAVPGRGGICLAAPEVALALAGAFLAGKVGRAGNGWPGTGHLGRCDCGSGARVALRLAFCGLQGAQGPPQSPRTGSSRGSDPWRRPPSLTAAR